MIRRLLVSLFLVVVVSAFARAQSVEDTLFKQTNSTNIKAMFGYSSIGGQSYVGTRIQPELNLGKIGVGFDIPILFSTADWSFRNEEYVRGVGALRLVRYVRYGRQKIDKIYVKLGELDHVMIGYGGLMNNYTNTSSQERRKIGAHWDIRIGEMFGIEGMYSDFNMTSLNLAALRPYVRPLAKTSIPIIKSLEIGGTYIADFDQTYEKKTDTTTVRNAFTRNGISAYGVDAGLTLLNLGFLKWDIFGEAAQLNADSDTLRNYFQNPFKEVMQAGIQGTPLENGNFRNGFGYSYGTNLHLSLLLKMLNFDLRFVRMDYSDNYIPQFFNATYEINKDASLWALGRAGRQHGYFGQLTTNIFNIVRVRAGLMMPDNMNDQNPAYVQADAALVNVLENSIYVRGSYIKGGLTRLGDAFTLDSRSLASVRAAYKFTSFLMVGVDYYWTFAKDENGNFQASNYWSPYFGLSFDLGKKK